MASVVYALCMLTSALCAVLLWRAYRASRARLLLWSSLAFIGLACNNLLLFVDLVVVPTVDLSLYRALMSAVSVMVLLLGLIWDSN